LASSPVLTASRSAIWASEIRKYISSVILFDGPGPEELLYEKQEAADRERSISLGDKAQKEMVRTGNA